MVEKTFSKSLGLLGSAAIAFSLMVPAISLGQANDADISQEQLDLVQKVEQVRINAIKKVYHAVVAVYGEDRGGGGSGVIIDPSGIALTNHHVVQGAGASGWGGLADGKLYRWDLIGTDPGGDVAIIKLKKNKGDKNPDFPYSAIGDSDKVKVGDWAIAMGNPFILAEDQTPTVTLGIVSGVERYQPGAGSNQLVYGNCIQVDSSINPGNSGGPLFNLNGEVIGINGRGSFKARGRVNVGLGYAISTKQIQNFIPDLLATKLVEHGTLDAAFQRRDGKVVCSSINLDSEIAKKGLALGDELLKFENEVIKNADQFTNLISTFPETWPITLTFKKDDGTVKTASVRLFGLPYNIPPPRKPRPTPKGKKKQEPTPAQKKAIARAKAFQKIMQTVPGTIRDKTVNHVARDHVFKLWKSHTFLKPIAEKPFIIESQDKLIRNGEEIGSQVVTLSTDGRFMIAIEREGKKVSYAFDGEKFWESNGVSTKEVSNLDARLNPEIIQVSAFANVFHKAPLAIFGEPSLDGSGKSQLDIAYRIKTLDKGSDWFYTWISLYDENKKDRVLLSKASPDLNADGETGAVVFKGWEPINDVLFPTNRLFVNGIEEIENYRAVSTNRKVLDNVDEKLFRLTNETE